MLKDMAGALAAAGHDVAVLTTQPSYGSRERCPWEETLDGFRVRRFWMFAESKKNWVARGANLVLFGLRLAAHLLRGRYDIAMVATTPPVFIAACVRWATRLAGRRFVYHCQDIHPELSRFSNLIGDGVPYKLLRSIDTATAAAATRVVVLSDDMKSSMLARGRVDAAQIAVINNFSASRADTPDAAAAPALPDGYKAVFAGNLGYFQGLDALVQAATAIDDPNFRLIMVGDGAARQRLEAAAARGPRPEAVRFLGMHSRAVADAIVVQCDVAIVSVAPGILSTAYPSKTIAYTEAGMPILLIGEVDSELARLVTGHRIGYVAPPDDSAALITVLRDAVAGTGDQGAMKSRSRAVFEQYFEKNRQLARWVQLYAELEHG